MSGEVCNCGASLILAEVQDMHQKAAGRLTLVCMRTFQEPESCIASRITPVPAAVQSATPTKGRP